MARVKVPPTPKGTKVEKSKKSKPIGVATRTLTNPKGFRSKVQNDKGVQLVGFGNFEFTNKRAIPKYVKVEMTGIETDDGKIAAVKIDPILQKKKPSRKKDPQLRKFYNQEGKGNFLKTCPKNREIVYNRIFSQAKILEEKKGRDLSTFSEAELLEFYSYLNSDSANTLRNINSHIVKYMEHCGRDKDDIPRIRSYTLVTKCNKVAVEKKISLRREDLLNYIDVYKEDSAYNPVDAFIALALFEGINGSGLNEIGLLLDKSIFQKDGKYYVNIEGPHHRILEISPELYQLGKDTASRDYRVSYDVNSKVNRKIIPLVDNKYLVRKVRKDNWEESNHITYLSIKHYFDNFKNVSGLGSYFGPKMIIFSGQLDMAERGAKELGISLYDFVRDTTLVKKIADRFGANYITLRNTFVDYIKKKD